MVVPCIPATRQRFFDKLRMTSLQSGNKETEVALAGLMRRNGITGWRRNQRVMGKPDFVFRRERVAVFVDGCFWHGCPKHANMPANNRAFWKKKLTGNKRRDKVVNRALRKAGWKVIRIWEHELVKNPDRCLRRIRQATIHGSAMYPH